MEDKMRLRSTKRLNTTDW